MVIEKELRQSVDLRPFDLNRLSNDVVTNWEVGVPRLRIIRVPANNRVVFFLCDRDLFKLFRRRNVGLLSVMVLAHRVIM